MSFKTFLLSEMTEEQFLRVKNILKSNFHRRHLELRIPPHAIARSTDGDRGGDVDEQYLIQALQAFLKQFDAQMQAQEGSVFEFFRECYMAKRGRISKTIHQNRAAVNSHYKPTLTQGVIKHRITAPNSSGVETSTTINIPVQLQIIGNHFVLGIRTVMVADKFGSYETDTVMEV